MPNETLELGSLELPLNEGLVRGLDLSRPAKWCRCPFCGGDVVLGHEGQGFELRHSTPSCATFNDDPRQFGKRAKSAGAEWHHVTIRYAEAKGGAL